MELEYDKWTLHHWCPPVTLCLVPLNRQVDMLCLVWFVQLSASLGRKLGLIPGEGVVKGTAEEKMNMGVSTERCV